METEEIRASIEQLREVFLRAGFSMQFFTRNIDEFVKQQGIKVTDRICIFEEVNNVGR
jgi:hypothetical protein